jgi:transposase-like protein
MSDISTELNEAVSQGANLSDAWNELMRKELEHAINELLQSELTSFLDYEKWDIAGYNSGNSRNGSYAREMVTRFGKISIEVLRDRNGDSQQHTVSKYRRNDGSLEEMVIQMYTKGITTSGISDLIEKMYGSYCTPATISNMTKTPEELVKEFHSRSLSSRYSVIYGDATYINVRRGSVVQEAMHILMRINTAGHKEILEYRLFPSESCENYREMLKDIKGRGVKEVLLFVSDGLKELGNVFFPKAQYQACWVHLGRAMCRYARNKDRKEVLGEAKKIYGSFSKEGAEKQMSSFTEKYDGKYSKAVNVIRNNPSLFSFYDYPEEIQRSLYTSNPIESFNKKYKKNIRKKEQFPNEDLLDRFTYAITSDYNKQFESRQMKGFSKCSYELQQLFEQR